MVRSARRRREKRLRHRYRLRGCRTSFNSTVWPLPSARRQPSRGFGTAARAASIGAAHRGSGKRRGTRWKGQGEIGAVGYETPCRPNRRAPQAEAAYLASTPRRSKLGQQQHLAVIAVIDERPGLAKHAVPATECRRGDALGQRHDLGRQPGSPGFCQSCAAGFHLQAQRDVSGSPGANAVFAATSSASTCSVLTGAAAAAPTNAAAVANTSSDAHAEKAWGR